MSDDAPELKAVDGLQLDEAHREVLRPGIDVRFNDGVVHALPRFFYQVPSWPDAHRIEVAPHFKLAELMTVDCRETPLQLKRFPHHVPCAILLLARYLELFRIKAGAPVFVAANGGYRSPSHKLNHPQSMHQWATAANIYRVGDTYLDDQPAIEKYARIAASIGDEVFVRPYAAGDDHMHMDIGVVTLTPREMNEVPK